MKPLLICMTPVKNEAWCLDLFIQCASLWADHIIIADQNSTDGSQAIAKKYPKVTLIENKAEQFNEDQRQKMLIDEARKIPGDKILIALDADEIFSANFTGTNDWKNLLNSNPGEVFGFQWANITSDQKNYFPSSFYFPWAIHDDGTEHENYVRPMHSMRIPYPKSADTGYYNVKDFKVLHLAWLNEQRVDRKTRFYQCMVAVREPDENPVSIYRTYHRKTERTYPLPEEWVKGYEKYGIHFFESLNLSEQFFWYDEEVLKNFQLYGITKFRYLDIWNKKWRKEVRHRLRVKDPRNIFIRLLHLYLKSTERISASRVVRLSDKLVKRFF